MKTLQHKLTLTREEFAMYRAGAYATIHHPVAVSEVVIYKRPREDVKIGRVAVVEGQLGNLKVWWYRIDGDAKRVCENHISDVRK